MKKVYTFALLITCILTFTSCNATTPVAELTSPSISQTLKPSPTPYVYKKLNYKKVFKSIYEEIYWYSDDNIMVKLNGKFGIMNDKEVFSIKPEWDRLDWQDELYIAGNNNKFGIINKTEDIIVPLEYDEISKEPNCEGDISKDPYYTRIGDKYGMLDYKGNVILEAKWQELYCYGALIQVAENDKHGLYDNTGKLIVPVIYEDIITNGTVTAVKKTGRWYTADANGAFTVQLPGEANQIDENNNIHVTVNGKEGLVNPQGVTVLDCEYYGIWVKNEHYYNLEKNNLFGLADSTGKILLPVVYSSISSYLSNEHIFIALSEEKSYIINVQKNKTEEGRIDEEGKIDEFDRKYAVIKKNLLQGVFDIEGFKVTAPIKYNSLKYINDNRFLALLNSNYSIIDNKGNTIAELNCSSAWVVNDKVVIIRDNKQGLADADGKELIPAQWQTIEDFGMSHVKEYYTLYKDGKRGVADENGKLLVSPLWDSVEMFNDKFIVKQNGLYGLTDTKGNLSVPPVLKEFSSSVWKYNDIILDTGQTAIINFDGSICSDKSWKNVDFVFDDKHAVIETDAGLLAIEFLP